MTPAQITGSTFRGGLLRGVLAGAVALLVVYGVLFLTSSEQTATAQAPCEQGTAVSSPADNPGLVSDCAILLSVKDTLRGSDRLNWSADRAITEWEGITVRGTPARVTRLWLDRNTSPQLHGRRITLTGTIPPELGELSKLEWLTLARHELTGVIPVELANLSELTDLRLFGNDLTGGIPPELGNLSNLTRLDLNGNPLGGSIPVELGKLTNLRSLRLLNNQLTGSIPASLGALSNLSQLNLYGNTGLTGCIPASLRGITRNDLASLGLEYCTTTTTHSLTTSAEGKGRVSPLPGTYSYLSGASVTVTATPDEGNRVASWGDDCSASGTAATCALTLDANRTASVIFERITHTLAVTVEGEGGSVTPGGTTTHNQGDEVTLTASWNDATHSFTGWGGDCSASGTASTCVLTMDGAKTVTATFAALAADRCEETTDADCIRAVYLGAPGDYAQVSDIPADVLLTPATDGRYYVERGRQYTVVTAAPLPEGWTRFYLEVSPLEFGTPSPNSYLQLIPPVGTTYTFTVNTDEAAPTLFTVDLTAARPHPVRPTHKPELGDVVVTTQFQALTCQSGIAVPNPTANVDLVEDCATLLGLRETLAGTGTLNWTAGRPMMDWGGITIEGTPQRVTKLELANSGLTGALSGLLGDLTELTELRLSGNTLTGRVPSKLQQLTALTHLYLADNSLTGCVPPSLRNVSNNDLASLGLPDCGPPADTSYGEHMLGEGSYQFTLADTPLNFDVPAGLRLEVVGLVLSGTDEGDGTASVGLILRNTAGGSWICLDVEQADECSRWMLDLTADTIQPLLDRVAESAWMGTAP